MPHQADVPGESYGDVYEQEYPCRSVLWVMPGTEFQENVREYRHREATDPDSGSAREKEQRDPNEDGVEDKEKHEPVPSYKRLHLIPENVEEKTIGEEMEGSAVEELIEEKLDSDLKIESLYKEEWIHPVGKNIAHKKGHRRHDKGEEYEQIGETIIAHRGV